MLIFREACIKNFYVELCTNLYNYINQVKKFVFFLSLSAFKLMNIQFTSQTQIFVQLNLKQFIFIIL